MAQVSKRRLPELLEKRIYEILWRTISDVTTPEQAEKLLADLLTQTERIMLAKRMAIAVMLEAGSSYLKIRDTLHVSTATIMVVKNRFHEKGDGYKAAVAKLSQDKKIRDLFSKIGEKLEGLTEARPYSPKWIEEQKAKRERKLKQDLPI